jgi:TFIIF-interacting CTD phosphatase-like protein
MIKDLRLIGRDLSKTIIIDNLPENFCLTPDNGIPIPDFCGEFEDNELPKILDFLTEIARNRVPDVRPVVN